MRLTFLQFCSVYVVCLSAYVNLLCVSYTYCKFEHKYLVINI